MKPILKWVGGKTQLLNDIVNNLPTNKKSITTYIEPFIGGCSVMLNIIKYFPNINSIVIADYNYALINLYNVVKDNPYALIEDLYKFETAYKSDPDPKKFYLEKRDIFNCGKNIQAIADPVLFADLFIFLNKTCFNGLYRENKKGEFNVPWNGNTKQTICDANNIMAVSEFLNEKNVNIICSSYNDTIKNYITENSFVYLDPPYRPLDKLSAFTAYTKSGFNDDDQICLKELCDLINDKKSYFMLSNSDPHNTDPNDNFFDDLYKDYNIQRVYAARNINSNGNKRGKISEILVTNYDNK